MNRDISSTKHKKDSLDSGRQVQRGRRTEEVDRGCDRQGSRERGEIQEEEGRTG